MTRRYRTPLGLLAHIDPGGSPDRARKALNAETIAELHRAFRIGGRQAINKVIRNNPAMFLKLLVMLVPRELQVEHSGGVKAMTDEQLEQSLAVLKEMIAQRDAGANAKVIEGVAEPVRTRKPRRERKSLSQRVLENVPVPMQQDRE